MFHQLYLCRNTKFRIVGRSVPDHSGDNQNYFVKPNEQ